MFVESEVLLEVSFDAARAGLVSLIRGGALLAASQDAYGDGAGGPGLAGPREPVLGMSRLVGVKFTEPVNRGDSVVAPLRWEAIGPGGGLFPALDADITLAVTGNGATVLRLAGAYRSPLEAAEAGLDRAALHRVATATIQGFLERVGAAIASPAPVTGAARENGRRGPSWRPPETEVS